MISFLAGLAQVVVGIAILGVLYVILVLWWASLDQDNWGDWG